MEYEQKRKLIITIIALVILGLIGLFIWGAFNAKNPGLPVSELGENNKEEVLNNNLGQENNDIINEEIQVVPDIFSEARRIARLVVERYGSYSSQTNYENVVDVISYTTGVLRENLNKTLEEKRKAIYGSETYSGATTKVLSDEVLSASLEGDKAIIRLQTQKITSLSSGKQTIDYPIMEVSLSKENEEWLVEKIESIK